jgi:hypothetical protein
VSSNALVLAELLLVLGGAIAFGLWELHTLRRDKRRAARENKKPGGAEE